MFWAINKHTNERVNALQKEFSEEFFKDEEWFADPTFIKELPKELDISKIETKYKKESKLMISDKGNTYFRLPHFFIPNSTKLGITSKPSSKEHDNAVKLICNLIKNKKIKIVYSKTFKPVEKENIFYLDLNLIDFNKIDIEVSIKSCNTKRADILIPLKEYHSLIGFGIVIEIQLTKQSDNEILKRSFDRANKGFSVCWIMNSELDNGIYNKDSIKVTDFSTIMEEYIETSKDYIKDLTINYSSMMDNKLQEMKNLVNQLNYPAFKDCPKCDGLLSKRKGGYGEFYGCSNYPRCKYTISLS